MGILNKTLEYGNKKFPSGSSRFFIFEEGDNRIRIVSPFEVFGQHYIQGVGYKVCIGKDKGCPYCGGEYKVNPTFFCWIIDRKDGNIKEAKFSYTVLKSIDDTTAIEEYNFNPEVNGVFPYDINIRMINGKGKNEKRQYNILPGAFKELTEEEKQEIVNLKHPMEMVKLMRNKQMEDGGIPANINEEIPISQVSAEEMQPF